MLGSGVEKICRQLQLDAKEYAVQMEKFGIAPKESVAFDSWSRRRVQRHRTTNML